MGELVILVLGAQWQSHFQSRKGPWHQPGLPVRTGYMCQASAPQISGTIFISQPIPSFGRQGRGGPERGPESGRSHSKATAEGLPAHATSHSRDIFPNSKSCAPPGNRDTILTTPGEWPETGTKVCSSAPITCPCWVHLGILARGMVPGGWQELRETRSTKSRFGGERPGGRIHFWAQALGWGVEEQELIERKYASGFPGLRIQPGCPEQAATPLAPSSRNPRPQSEIQVAPNHTEPRDCLCFCDWARQLSQALCPLFSHSLTRSPKLIERTSG